MQQPSSLDSFSADRVEFRILAAAHGELRPAQRSRIRQEVRKFARFLKYQSDPETVDLSIPAWEIDQAIATLSVRVQPDGSPNPDFLLGMDQIAAQMRTSFQLFGSNSFLPRGVLLHGPPGRTDYVSVCMCVLRP